MKLHEIYTPRTATPFACDEGYREFAPCEELKPYIKCFWGTKEPIRQTNAGTANQTVVTPDTCMDIIFTVDFTANKIGDIFCGLNDAAFVSRGMQEERLFSTFAIRFYAWSAVVFSQDSLRDTKNGFFDAGCHFEGLKKALGPLLFEVTGMEERMAVAQRYLLSHMHPERQKSLLMDAVAGILMRRGNVEISRLAGEIHTSTRQLERVCKETMGISPKLLASLVRYQYLWNDILLTPGFQVQDAVYRYGYTDQAHLLREFKRFHTMSISQAKRHAFQHVAFLQS